MSIIAAKSWLPPELTVVQPYSMGPLMCRPERGCARDWAAPAVGTCVGMDRPELMISACFVAPPEVQREALKSGRRDIIMMVPRGLPELLEADPRLWPRGLPREAGADPETRPVIVDQQTFMDQLAALDEDD